jgi:glycosyltransferase involved in cell wall biosynthesis
VRIKESSNSKTIDNKYPFVSVVICSLNGHYRICKAIDSVLEQEYPNIEIIIIDDGSDTSLWPVIENYNDKRIRFYRIEFNIGLHAARSFATEQAQGEYIALLDDDDRWMPKKLNLQIPVLLESSKIGLVCGGSIDIFPNGAKMLRLPPNALITHRQEIIGENIIASSVIFRKEAYDKVGGFDKSLCRCGDWECWIRLSKSYEIRAIMEPLVMTYMRPNSLQRSNDISDFEKDRWKVIIKHQKEIRDLGLWDEALSNQFQSIGVRYLRIGEFDLARKYLKRSFIKKMNLSTLIALVLSLLKVINDFKFRQIYRKLKAFKRNIKWL